jgi:hypothetical protein
MCMYKTRQHKGVGTSSPSSSERHQIESKCLFFHVFFWLGREKKKNFFLELFFPFFNFLIFS